MDAYIPIGTDSNHYIQIQLIHGDICNDDTEAVGIFRIRGDLLEKADTDQDNEKDTPSSARKFAEGLFKGEILGIKLPGTPSVPRKLQENPTKDEIFTVKLPESPLPVKKTDEDSPATVNKFTDGFKEDFLRVRLPDAITDPMKFAKRNLLGGFKQTKKAPNFAKPTEMSLELWKIAGEEAEAQFRTISTTGDPFASRGVVMTTAGNLCQKQMLHLLVSEDPDKLHETILSALRLAEKEHIRSVSFPALPIVLQHGTNIRILFNTFEEFAKRDHPNYLRFIRIVVSETEHEMPSYMNAREVYELRLYQNFMLIEDIPVLTEARVEQQEQAITYPNNSPRVSKHEFELSKDEFLRESIEMTEYGHGNLKLPSNYSEQDTVQIGRPLTDFDCQTVSQTVDTLTVDSHTFMTADSRTVSSSSSSTSSDGSDSSSSSSESSSDESEENFNHQRHVHHIDDEVDSNQSPKVIAEVQLPSIPVSRLDLDPLQIGDVATTVTRVHNSGSINQALINFVSPDDNLGGTEIVDGVTTISVGSRTMFNITLSDDPGKFPRLRTMIHATLREANREGFRQVNLPGNAVSCNYIQAPYGLNINPVKIYPLLCFQAINDFALYDYNPAILNSIHIVVEDRQTLGVFDEVRKVFESFHGKRVQLETKRGLRRKNKDRCCRWYCYWRIFTFGWDFTVEINHSDLRSCCCCCCSQKNGGGGFVGAGDINNRVGSAYEQNIVSSYM